MELHVCSSMRDNGTHWVGTCFRQRSVYEFAWTGFPVVTTGTTAITPTTGITTTTTTSSSTSASMTMTMTATTTSSSAATATATTTTAGTPKAVDTAGSTEDGINFLLIIIPIVTLVVCCILIIVVVVVVKKSTSEKASTYEMSSGKESSVSDDDVHVVAASGGESVYNTLPTDKESPVYNTLPLDKKSGDSSAGDEVVYAQMPAKDEEESPGQIVYSTLDAFADPALSEVVDIGYHNVAEFREDVNVGQYHNRSHVKDS
jgi:hypothetical protein